MQMKVTAILVAGSIHCATFASSSRLHMGHCQHGTVAWCYFANSAGLHGATLPAVQGCIIVHFLSVESGVALVPFFASSKRLHGAAIAETNLETSL